MTKKATKPDPGALNSTATTEVVVSIADAFELLRWQRLLHSLNAINQPALRKREGKTEFYNRRWHQLKTMKKGATKQ